MTESSFRARVRMRRKAQQRQLLIIIFSSMLLGCWLWYSFIYTRTPDYAVNQLKQAVEQHDADKFRKYTNLELLTSNAFDDLSVDFFSFNSAGDPHKQAIFKKYYTLVRPQIVNGTAELILRHVRHGGWPMADGNDIMKGNRVGVDYEWFIECSLLRSTSLKDIGSIVKNGNTATCDMTVINDYTGTPFTLKLSMEQSEAGHWQVCSVDNYHSYLAAALPQIRRDTLEYIRLTRPISNSYIGDFITQRTRFKKLISSARGSFNDSEKASLRQLVEKSIIPTLTDRQAELDAKEAKPGAQYLVKLRQQSTKTSINAWKHFLAGIINGNQDELNTAAILHKQEMELDTRIENIIECCDN